ncbi:hypothetical protein M0811_02972 [Anaeramoeba ignava]|uniref:F-box domain-containing protein n=1 Tax=Anaeramoeba ignava TaxID=1746090 RepID=A0A9Q0R563_ANAIG|nr:hypothetical protein M0811_02972 [Anaeramoeba ignava]
MLLFELLIYIFTFLPKSKLCITAQVCKKWKEASFHASLWREIFIDQQKISRFQLSKLFSRTKQLRSFILHWPKALTSKMSIDDILSLISKKCPVVQSLRFSQMFLTFNLRNELTNMKKFQNLTDFRLISCKLFSNLQIVSQCRKLKVLHLETIGLANLDKEFSELVELEELNLGFNNFNTIPPEILKLPKLIKLNMDSNLISSLDSPEIIQFIDQLEYLLLSYNQISSIPVLNNDPKLIKLDLSFNRFSSIDSLLQFKNLRMLNLFNNELTQFPKEIHQWKFLKKIYLSFNHLSQVDSITQLENCTKIWIDNNRITHLPLQFLQMKKLKLFNCSYNQIQIFPIELALCQSLEYLTFSENPWIDQEISHMAQLRATREEIQRYFTNSLGNDFL